MLRNLVREFLHNSLRSQIGTRVHSRGVLSTWTVTGILVSYSEVSSTVTAVQSGLQPALTDPCSVARGVAGL